MAELPRQARELRGRYENGEAFLLAFNPGIQAAAAREPMRCFFGSAPTLRTVELAFGDDVSVAWLIAQLTDMSASCGTKKKMADKDQLKQLAEMIAQRYYWLRASELMLFFWRVKIGDYMETWGEVDGREVMKALKLFIKDRAAAIERRDLEAAAERARQSREGAVSFEEWCSMTDREPSKVLQGLFGRGLQAAGVSSTGCRSV